jgi:hypothetical protein
LLKHLQGPYSDGIIATIARSLAVPEPAVRDAWPLLVEQYKKAPIKYSVTTRGHTKEYKFAAKEALACALSIAVTDETLEELIDLAKDPSHGESRILLLEPLRKSKNPMAKKAIEELVKDPELSKEIMSWRRSVRK